MPRAGGGETQKVVISFADLRQNHHGGIYQAGGWTYTGVSDPDLSEFFHNGLWRNQRSVTSKKFRERHGNPRLLPRRPASAKHRYLYPLDKPMRETLAEMTKPYPIKAT